MAKVFGASVAFDCGTQLPEVVPFRNVFLTHGHLDHVGGLHHHAATRSMQRMAVPTYFAPPCCIEPLRLCLAAHIAMQREGTIEADWVDLSPGDTVVLGRKHTSLHRAAEPGWAADDASSTAPGMPELPLAPATPAYAPPKVLSTLPSAGVLVTPWRTEHRVPSMGFVVSHRRQKLLASLQGQSSDVIRAAKAAGQPVTEAVDTPLLAVSGDTTFPGILAGGEPALTARVLVIECTFVDATVNSVHDTQHQAGHTHLEQVAPAWAEGVFRNSHLMLVHFSPRFLPAQTAAAVGHRLATALLALCPGPDVPARWAAVCSRLAERPIVHAHVPPRSTKGLSAQSADPGVPAIVPAPEVKASEAHSEAGSASAVSSSAASHPVPEEDLPENYRQAMQEHGGSMVHVARIAWDLLHGQHHLPACLAHMAGEEAKSPSGASTAAA